MGLSGSGSGVFVRVMSTSPAQGDAPADYVMSIWNVCEAREALALLTGRSKTDPDFRRLCLSDPYAAVREITGRDVPEGFHIQMLENAGAHLTVVLPDLVAEATLSDSDLEALAGGSRKEDQCANQSYGDCLDTARFACGNITENG